MRRVVRTTRNRRRLASAWTADRRRTVRPVQRWTLARVVEVIDRLVGVRYTLRGASCLLHRMGFTPQVPARRAAERSSDGRRDHWFVRGSDHLISLWAMRADLDRQEQW